MTESKHTPGPWVHKSYKTKDTYETKDEVIGSNGDVVCCNTPFYPTGITRADARLIAAAPDMLEALRGLEGTVLAMMDDPSRADDMPAFQKARAAIAKAEGRDT